MKEYLLMIWNRFKKCSVLIKSLFILLILLYISIIVICVYPVKVDSTLPGTVNNVSNVIDINTENDTGSIYTVSIYSENKMSLLSYWLVSLDKNSDISLGESISLSIFTENEEYLSNVGYKKQSIQDSLIIAYTYAYNQGYDVSLKHTYSGEYLIHIPQNLYKTGAEDFKNSDIIIGYNDTKFINSDDYYNSLNNIFTNIIYEGKSVKQYKEEGKFEFYDENNIIIHENINLVFNLIDYMNSLTNTTYKFNVLRDNKEISITPSMKMLFYIYSHFLLKEDIIYSVNQVNFSYFNINYSESNPKINISSSTSVGPSGGLMQTLAVYNAITKDDITKGLSIMGTGGIDLNGNATSIGGEQQKIVTANLYEADLFFIPEENYESAKEMYDTIANPTYDLISVSNFNDVLYYLNKLEVSNE